MEYIEIRLACYKSGLVFCAFTDDFDEQQVLETLNQVECRLFIYDQRISPDLIRRIKHIFTRQINVSLVPQNEQGMTYAEFINNKYIEEPVSVVKSHEISAIGFTSGTTGAGKAVIWSHRAWIYSFYHFLLNAPKIDVKNRVLLHSLPFSTAGSLSILPGLALGGKNILLQEFNAESVSKAIEQFRVTDIVLCPSFMIDLWDYYQTNQTKLDFSSLRSISIGSAPLVKAKLLEMIKVFGPIIQQGYGMAEALAPLAAYKYENPKSEANNFDTVGKPIQQINLKLQALPQSKFSRILVKSETCCEGYWKNGSIDKSAFENGWFATSDLGSFDNEGLLYIHDREINIVRRNGEEILARDLEEILHKYPGVKDVVVTFHNDELKVWVSPLHGFQLTDHQVKQYCLVHYPKCFLPDSFQIVSKLPYSKSGKVLKNLLLTPGKS